MMQNLTCSSLFLPLTKPQAVLGCGNLLDKTKELFLAKTIEDGPVVYPANAFDSRLRGD